MKLNKNQPPPGERPKDRREREMKQIRFWMKIVAVAVALLCFLLILKF